MDSIQRLRNDYPWIQTPLVVGAPMRLIALADLAVAISKAGGIGFIGAGTDVSDLETYLESAGMLLQDSPVPTTNGTIPLGVGFINWGADLSVALPVIARFKPAAIWFFAPSSVATLKDWSERCRRASPHSRIWVQIGSVREARDVVWHVRPDVLVVQGTDAGGHGLAQGAGLISLLPEVDDAVSALLPGAERPVLIAAGGIVEARGAAASLLLGASGTVMGTRFLASHEAVLAKGYQDEVLRASDGGQTTVRTKAWDNARGTKGWAETHNGRGIVNRTYTDAVGGMADEENKRLYEEDVKKGDQGWGADARLCTYAGSAVGLVKEVKGAGEIVREVREGMKGLVKGTRARF
ncbi:inosine monophosphate dehydrogenase [Didymella exigua CBS 183.55]|uniref:Inosine monophosphate dehydrogenase n=1 Tax=Didymella exigua CBS 183.55 TaxID=1150837 RepID=A0A6A5RX29_9PLEO|nr:inosine monophosphate dehydrogenase [Didymella exigua CBS 183.55]KAF1929817.1 inosine monophosphate dehydrogenase [Didymella exigua CBS 183.55]